MKSYLGTDKSKIEPFQRKVVTPSLKHLTLYSPVTFGFRRILFFFKLIGRYPSVPEQIWDEGICYFKYNMSVTKHTIGFFILGFISAGIILLAMMQWGSLGFQLFPAGELWPDRLAFHLTRKETFGSYAAGITSSFECIYCLLGVIEFLPAWLQRKQFQEWLNNWNAIEKDMLSLRGFSGEVFDSKFANRFTILYVGFPTFVFGTMIVFPELDPTRMFANFVFCYLCYASNALISSEDIRTVLIMKTLRDAYIKVRVNMENMRNWKLSGSSLSRSIDTWNRLLIGIRSQTKLGSDCVAFQTLLFIFLLVYFSAASVFLIFDEFSGNNTKSNLQIILTFTLINFVRIYCKLFYASRIAEEESNVVAAAKQLELSNGTLSQEDRLKIMRLHDMLICNPVKISLGGYATMSNSLLVSILSQVLTQSIVFMQFQQSSK